MPKGGKVAEFGIDMARDDYQTSIPVVQAVALDEHYQVSSGISSSSSDMQEKKAALSSQRDTDLTSLKRGKRTSSSKGSTISTKYEGSEGGDDKGNALGQYQSGSGGGSGYGGKGPKSDYIGGSGSKQQQQRDSVKDNEKKEKMQRPPFMSEVGRTSSTRWPANLCSEVVSSFGRGVNEAAASQFLNKRNWTTGMQKALFHSCKKIPMRFFIVDDSGSMNTNDGSRIIRDEPSAGKKTAKMISCTRWAELTDSLKFHAELSEALQAPSEFRLLNGADPVMVGLGGDNSEGLEFAQEVFEEQPAGQTPLCHHVTCVVNAISQMEAKLRQGGKKACVVIATDGESSDGNITEALRPLQNLPVWVVLRLCTNQQAVVDYWNNIDKELELEMDVIDDLHEDACQVAAVNGWLNYGDEMHRLREFGASFKEMDLIDESALGSEQMKSLLETVFACKLPHPEIDWGAFKNAVAQQNDKTPPFFNPLTKSFGPMVDMAKLDKGYNPDAAAGSSACSMM